MTFAVPLNESAVETFTNALSHSRRVLVLGGTGWFGRTALAMLSYLDVDVHIVASYQREFEVDGRNLLARAWDPSEIARFEPEIVLDFAYQTVNKALALGIDAYKKINGQIAQQLFFAARLPSTSRVLTVSSGASVHLPFAMRGKPAAEAYAQGKREIEEELESIASQRKLSIGIARAWSVSGGHVQNPSGYAFSGMILQALDHGRIQVYARHPVYRRYSAAEELLALAIPDHLGHGLRVIDSGGQLVELRQLAHHISDAIAGCDVSASDNFQQSQSVDSYYSEGTAWDKEVEFKSLSPLGLEAQIENVVRSLRNA